VGQAVEALKTVPLLARALETADSTLRSLARSRA